VAIALKIIWNYLNFKILMPWVQVVYEKDRFLVDSLDVFLDNFGDVLRC